MRENREKNDLVTKNFETFPDVAADIINALLHNGKLVVTKENLLRHRRKVFIRAEKAGCETSYRMW